MGNASSGETRGRKTASKEGGGKGSSIATEEGSGSSSRKEEVEARVEHQKGLGFLAAGRHEDALKAFDESLKFRRMLNHENSHEYASTLLNHAVALSFVSTNEVIGHFDEAFNVHRKVGSETSVSFASGLAHLGRYYHRQNHHAEAKQKLKQAIEMLDGPLLNEPGSRSESFSARRDLADMLARSGEGEAATTLCKALLDECKDNIWRGQILTILARAKLKMGQKEEARQHLDQALELLTRHNPNEPAWLTRQKAESHRVAAEALRLECT